MWRAKDLSGLLLLYSAKGSASGMKKLVELSKEQGKQNVAFLGLFLLGQLDECVDLLVSSGRTPEAAFFARTYLPSRMSEVGWVLLHDKGFVDTTANWEGGGGVQVEGMVKGLRVKEILLPHGVCWADKGVALFLIVQDSRGGSK